MPAFPGIYAKMGGGDGRDDDAWGGRAAEKKTATT